MILMPVRIGDVVERNLSWMGITPARIERLFRIKSCGCGERQSALNVWGFETQYWIIMYVGGPADMAWRQRLIVVRGRLWKTITSRLTMRSGSGVTRR